VLAAIISERSLFSIAVFRIAVGNATRLISSRAAARWTRTAELLTVVFRSKKAGPARFGSDEPFDGRWRHGPLLSRSIRVRHRRATQSPAHSSQPFGPHQLLFFLRRGGSTRMTAFMVRAPGLRPKCAGRNPPQARAGRAPRSDPPKPPFAERR
jgi:hypothetical protein